MRNLTAVLVLTAFSTTAAHAAFYSTPDKFSSYGSNAALTSSSWTSEGAIVTNDTSVGFDDNFAAYFGEGTSATNTISEASPSPSRVWTDFRIKPALGVQPSGEIPAGVQTLFFFDTDGYIQYRNDDAWVTASNNIFGGAVGVATDDAWQRVSVFQDYTAGTFAIVLNDVVIAQDIPFVNAGNNYQRFTLDNQDSQAYLDNIRIHNSLPAELTDDNNAYVMADATELNTYGYVARTLSVEAALVDPAEPQFTQISDALAAYRAHDVITVAAGIYGAITVSNNVTLAGSGFTVASITVQDGATLTLPNAVVVQGAVTVAAGSALTLGANSSAASAAVAGTINVGNNTLTVSGAASLTGTGNIQIGTSGTLDADDISMVSGSQIVSAGGSLDNTLLSMTGTFTIEGANWNAGQQAQSLPFEDNFERYTINQTVTNLGLFGWSASDDTVKVQSGAAAPGSTKSVILPDGTELTLSIDGTGQERVWTDFYIRPALGVAPDDASSTVDKGFSSFVDNDGNLNAAMLVGATTNWVALTNRASWVSSTLTFEEDFKNQFSNEDFTRVSVFQDYEKSTFSVFVGTTNLVAVAEAFPGTHTAYSAFVVANAGTDAYLDDMRVLASLPFAPGDPTVDINGNSMDDREEIHWFGDLSTYAGVRGSLFRFM